MTIGELFSGICDIPAELENIGVAGVTARSRAAFCSSALRAAALMVIPLPLK